MLHIRKGVREGAKASNQNVKVQREEECKHSIRKDFNCKVIKSLLEILLQIVHIRLDASDRRFTVSLISED